MTAGHEAVKADLVHHLTDNIAGWMVLVRGSDSWPADPKLVAASDILPEGDDAYPCLLVSSSRKTSELVGTAGAADGTYTAVYDLTVRVACKSVRERDVDSASVGRDRLLTAVEWLLIRQPAIGDTGRVVAGMVSESDPVAVDTKGRPTALGGVTVSVRLTEIVPDPDAYGATGGVTVTVDAADAANDPDTDGPTHTATVTAP